MTRYLVTGGFGFIGSHLVDRLLADPRTRRVTVLDKMTHAALPQNLERHAGDRRLIQESLDVRSLYSLMAWVDGHDCILHLAAESHVDRATLDPLNAFETNAVGTAAVLEAARRAGIARVVCVSTDEVYGSLPEGETATEARVLDPASAYSAGKAAADLLARAYHATYGLETIVTRGANTYGPRQLPEKLIPRTIARALQGQRIPLYGDGRQVRDWLHVEDHVAGILTALRHGEPGGIYNISANEPRTNRSLVETVLRLTGKSLSLIEPVPDRPGHDRRYAIDPLALLSLGWAPTRTLSTGLKETVAWYIRNPDWLAAARARAGSFA